LATARIIFSILNQCNLRDYKNQFKNLILIKMNKLVSIIATLALFFSMNVNAQQEPKQKKKKAKTEKSCSSEEKKSCGEGEKKGGCCSSKKSEDKKS
jgi:hypothetical protein